MPPTTYPEVVTIGETVVLVTPTVPEALDAASVSDLERKAHVLGGGDGSPYPRARPH